MAGNGIGRQLPEVRVFPLQSLQIQKHDCECANERDSARANHPERNAINALKRAALTSANRDEHRGNE